jgi:hydroxylamine dehydrogenase
LRLAKDRKRAYYFLQNIESFIDIVSVSHSHKDPVMTHRRRIALLAALLLCTAPLLRAQNICVNCHKSKTPNIVSDWQLSRHAKNDITCDVCHGDEHNGPSNVDKVRIPTPETCAQCHETQVQQFKKGKHALAWAASNAMPTAHMQPPPLMTGMKGCNGCHKIGLKSEADIKKLKAEGQGYGYASCDACHTRHTFSKKEAQQPQACQTCHMGFDHPQWEMYSSSKHGVRALLVQNGTLPQGTAAPTCQTCHFGNGNHEVRTAWGFLAVRLPLPEDKQWADDRAAILMALGVLDPEGKPTGRVDVVKAADVARLTQEDWQKERDKMVTICSTCHSSKYAKGELAKGDEMIRQADHLMAEAIHIVAALYKDEVIPKPKNYTYAYPDLLTFHDAPTEVEQELFVMFLEHRMRTFQGTFHASPDYALWYGWSEMQRSLTRIRTLAGDLRAGKK